MAKGGSQTTSVQIPAWLENAAKANLSRAEGTAAIGPTPYYGPDVAALTPMQEAAMANTNRGAAAFGMTPSAGTGMPPPTTFAGGVQGYSSGSIYDQALEELKRRAPGQYAALRAPFMDPITGAMPSGVYSPGYTAAPPATQPMAPAPSYGGGNGGGGPIPRAVGGTGSFGLPDPMSGRFASTNLPGMVGGVVNRLTRAMDPAPVAETLRTAPKATTKAATKASASRGGTFRGGR